MRGSHYRSVEKTVSTQVKYLHPSRYTEVIISFSAAVSFLVGPCCPALLKLYRCKCAYCCIIGQINDDDHRQASTRDMLLECLST